MPQLKALKLEVLKEAQSYLLSRPAAQPVDQEARMSISCSNPSRLCKTMIPGIEWQLVRYLASWIENGFNYQSSR